MKVYVDYVRYDKVMYSQGLQELIDGQKLQGITDGQIVENFSF